MYADRITNSMRRTIDETNRRKYIQKAYNTKNGLTPQPLLKKKGNALTDSLNPYKITGPSTNKIIPNIENATSDQLKKMISHTKREMERMAKNLNFMEAARLRDELQELEEKLKNKA
jgi:excinuclease ABC subunit B